jgi:proline dehydrogenase
MNIVNKVIVGTIPLVPKSIVRKFANKYIAGDTLNDAVEVTKKLNAKGILTTMDVLGEDVFNKTDAENSKNESLEVIEAVEKNKLSSNLSLKLTSMGLKIDYDFCLKMVLEIFTAADKYGQFVRIDMEDHTCTDDTLRIYEDAHKSYSKCGVVIQAYLKRSLDDVSKLVKEGTNFRLCKGIYVEPEEIAYKKREEIQQNYLKLLRLMLENNCYVGIATHDDVLIDGSYKLIRELGKKTNEYEFQMLLGVRENLRDRILQDGHKVRVYVPFGSHWYQYSTRRFKENPQMAGYVFKSIFGGNK